MKKLLTAAALVLALALCLTAALAAGGDAGDPLISLSYLQSVFAPAAEARAEEALDAAEDALRTEMAEDVAGMTSQVLAAAGVSGAQSVQEADLNGGDVLSGTTGLTVLPLAGDVRLTVTKGAVVDATAGAEVPSGTLLTLNHRYIVAESSQARFTAESPAAVLSCQGPCTLSADGTSPDYFAIARALRDLDLFRGTGTGFGDGFDLHLAPTRAEGLVMFIRLLGEEKDALACQYAHPHTDVPAWADRYVAWAYQRGYTNGVSPTEFGPNGDITATQYMEFLLRALGYSTAGADDYTTALPRALALGAITQGEYNMLTQDPFLRAQVAYVSYYMLDMPVSGTQQTLAQRLQAAGLISEAQLSAARGQVDSPRLWLDSSSLH